MSNRSERSYLGDMLDYGRRAHAKVAAMRFEEWQADENAQLAVTYLVQIVGEAASHVSSVTRASLPDLPWARIVGMRHHLVHGYGVVNPEIIWRVANHQLPPLIVTLEKWLSDNPDS
jgi:uncharacterized protein with HEPN domain